MGSPIAGWLIIEHPISMDDLGVPPFSETYDLLNHHMIYERVSWDLSCDLSYDLSVWE